jgi:hypothetical protein
MRVAAVVGIGCFLLGAAVVHILEISTNRQPSTRERGSNSLHRHLDSADRLYVPLPPTSVFSDRLEKRSPFGGDR